MIARSLGLAILFVGTAPALAPVVPVQATRAPSSRPFWIDGAAATDAERELQAALGQDAASTRGGAALREVAHAHAGTSLGGLAHLARGLALLEAGHTADALEPLAHPDIDHTQLLDHALLARAKANEAEGRYHAATEAYAALARLGPDSPLLCGSRLRAAEVMTLVGRTAEALALLQEATASTCTGQQADVLRLVAHAHERAGDLAAAAAAMDALVAEHPLSEAAREEATHLRKLGAHRPPVTPAALLEREMRRGLALFDARRYREAAVTLRSALARRPGPDSADLVRVRLGRALLETGHPGDAAAALNAVSAGSPYAAEAAYYIARMAAQRARGPEPYIAVADRFPETAWGEEALLDLAHHHLKDGRDAEALPWFRRLADEYPRGKYADAALWRVGWADYLSGSFAGAADRLEKAARERPSSSYTSGFLYWAGRARRAMGHDGRADELFEETVRRFKHTYHGQRAVEALGQERAAKVGVEPVAATDPALSLTPGQAARVRNLLLIGQLDAAMDDLAGLPPTAEAQATRAVIHHRRGRLRAAINTMRRAYPESLGRAGDEMPREAWEILYPLEFGDALAAEAARSGVDPALVAALIWQESTFDPAAQSGAGARGLMQLMPRTGRELARQTGIPKFNVSLLFDPRVGLDLGTRYLKSVINAFGGREERALAAYNAGPGRVEIWIRARGAQSREEFIESIPYQETRRYVMNVLANREHYRRLYGLGEDPTATRERMAADD